MLIREKKTGITKDRTATVRTAKLPHNKGPVPIPTHSLSAPEPVNIPDLTPIIQGGLTQLRNESVRLIQNIINTGNSFLSQIKQLGEKVMKDLKELEKAVERSTTVQQSAIVLIQGLAEQLRNAGTDPALLGALASTLDAQANALSDAVVANTPAAPA